MNKMKTIAVVNGGSDAPGLNAAIREVCSEIAQAARAIGTTFGDSA
jgi:6-phosphofructokinase